MNVIISESVETLDQQVAQEIYDYVKENPTATLCLAAGDTPLGAFKKLKDFPQAKEVFQDCVFIGLDEWVGLNATDHGSCFATLNEHLFSPLGIREEQKHFFDGKATNLNNECVRMNAIVESHGSIDFMLLGIGMNGHLGFNEPGTSFDTWSHIVTLSESSRTIGQKYFSEKMKLVQGITLGFNHINEAKFVLLMAKGEKKKNIINQMLNEKVTTNIPATFLQRHHNCNVMIDRSVQV